MNKYTIITIHTNIVFCCVYQHWFITNDIGSRFLNNKGKISFSLIESSVPIQKMAQPLTKVPYNHTKCQNFDLHF